MFDYATYNESNALVEKMSEEKLGRKIIHSLVPRFKIKVTAIEEVQDITKMKVDELIEYLFTYEMSLDDTNAEYKNKGVAFKATDYDLICILIVVLII